MNVWRYDVSRCWSSVSIALTAEWLLISIRGRNGHVTSALPPFSTTGPRMPSTIVSVWEYYSAEPRRGVLRAMPALISGSRPRYDDTRGPACTENRVAGEN